MIILQKKQTSFPIHFEKIENPPYLNDSRFQAVRVYALHSEENYNGSYFELSVLEEMKQYFAGIPIVGFIRVDSKNELDFSGHEERLIITENNIEIEYMGRAYGCILSNSDVEIVDRMHEDGKKRKYIAATGIMWKMFSEAIDILDRDEKKPHSLELDENESYGRFKNNYFYWTKAKPRALCILGQNIPPGMSNSSVEKLSFSKDYSIETLLNEVNTSISKFNKRSDIVQMEGKLKILTKFNLKESDLDFKLEDVELDKLEPKLTLFVENKKKTEFRFSATANQKRAALRNALDSELTYDNEGNLIKEIYYYVCDYDDEYVYVERDTWEKDGGYESEYGRFTYTFDDSTLIATITSGFEKMVSVWLTIEENEKLKEDRLAATNYTALKSDFAKLEVSKKEVETKFENLQNKVFDLQQFQDDSIKQEKQNVFLKFTNLSEVDYQEIKDNMDKFTAQEIEDKLFAIVGRKNFAKPIEENMDKYLQYSLENDGNNDNEPSYSDIIRKHTK